MQAIFISMKEKKRCFLKFFIQLKRLLIWKRLK
jgi:hypothetical protein